MKVSFGDPVKTREEVINYLFHQKLNNPSYKVIDVGGSATSWTSEVADAFVDIVEAKTTKKQFVVDICKESSWKKIASYTSKNGLYDYCICTHTLEDIYNPYIALEYLPKIAKRGIITMPSVAVELSYIESSEWIGYIHHRYMFGFDGDEKDCKMIVVPKINVANMFALNDNSKIGSSKEIKFDWEENIPFEVFMNNYLGPNIQTLLQQYQLFVDNQLSKGIK